MDVVAAIILYKNRVLCMQRDKGKYEYISYKFEFPGGKVEPGETKAAALSRELLEEMGLDLDISENDCLMSSSHVYPDFSITLHAYLCRVTNPKFTLKEHKSFIWADIEEISSLDWAAADIPIVKEVVRRLSI